MIRRAALLALLASVTSCGARTGLSDEAYEPASLYCTDAVFVARPARDLALVAGVPRALRGLARWSVVTSPSGSTPTF